MISEGSVMAEAGTPPPAGRRLRPKAIVVLTVLAVGYTLYFARSFLLPVTLAILLSFLLSPVVGLLGKLRIPTGIAAALVVLGLLGGVGLGVYRLAGPVQDWSAKAPQAIANTERELRKLFRPFQRMSQTAKQVETAAGAVAGADTSRPPQEVVVRGPSLMSRLFGSTPHLIATVLEVIILLYFLLAAGDLFLRKLIKVLPNLTDKLKAIRIARQTQASISTYLGTAALINVAEGVVVALAMHLIGVPNAVLWGALAAILEFIPFLGAAALTIVLFIVGLTTFQDIGHALLPPGAFLLINGLQANLLYPILQGKRLALNPVAVFVGLAFWFWIWGIAGAFIAVPILATFKICCDHIEGLGPIGEFLGARDESPLP
jgi:predicted PurR-regulated permease PerM